MKDIKTKTKSGKCCVKENENVLKKKVKQFLFPDYLSGHTIDKGTYSCRLG